MKTLGIVLIIASAMFMAASVAVGLAWIGASGAARENAGAIMAGPQLVLNLGWMGCGLAGMLVLDQGKRRSR